MSMSGFRSHLFGLPVGPKPLSHFVDPAATHLKLLSSLSLDPNKRKTVEKEVEMHKIITDNMLVLNLSTNTDTANAFRSWGGFEITYRQTHSI